MVEEEKVQGRYSDRGLRRGRCPTRARDTKMALPYVPYQYSSQDSYALSFLPHSRPTVLDSYGYLSIASHFSEEH